MNAVVIGGGVGGLAVAIRLAVKGVGVTLLEKNGRVGGKLNRWEVPHPSRPGERPFQFDTGPSLLTLPFVFEELFAAAGERLSDHLDLVRLDPISRFVWGDGQTFELRSSLDETLRQVALISPSDVAGWRAIADRGRYVWDQTAELFLYKSPEQAIKDGGPFGGLKMAAVPFKIGMFSAFNKLIDKHIKHPRLREVLYQYATYSGASPFKAPATLAVIPHAEQHFGGWYPRGGMYQIAEALEALARKLGVDIRTNAHVLRILVEGKRAAGVLVEDVSDQQHGVFTVRSDIVIANSDVVYTYAELIDKHHRRKYSDRTLKMIDPGGSGMVLLLGVEGTYPQLAHHTKFMPADYRGDLSAMFETKSVPVDPCIYVAATTRTDPSQAPDGCENLFVLVSAPSLDGKLDWAVEGPRYRDQVVRTLESKWGLTDLSRRIVVEQTWTPETLRSAYHANAGSIYGIGSNSLRTAFLRPPNRDRDNEGLFFVGGATHPGGGLPLVALSGMIVSELILTAQKKVIKPR